jgi:hypothetical protein
VRDLLEEIRFEGHSIRWIEQKGLLEVRFLVRGSSDAVARFDAGMARMGRQLDLMERERAERERHRHENSVWNRLLTKLQRPWWVRNRP